MGAADTAAIGPFGIAGADTLNKGDGIAVFYRRCILCDLFVKLKMGHYPVVFTVQVFDRLIFHAAGGDNGSPVLHFMNGTVYVDPAHEITHRSGSRIQYGVFVYCNIRMLFQTGYGVGEHLLNGLTPPGGLQA